MAFISYSIGFYMGFLVWAPYKGVHFMTERCASCNGHGLQLEYQNEVSDCKKCNGYGRYTKTGLFYKIISKVFKITCL